MRRIFNSMAWPNPANCGAVRRFARSRFTIENRKSKIENPRRAFTLIELLVSIAILVLLTALVLAAFRRDDSDRLNASARLLQSYFEGARSRAISDDQPRGVRLIRSPNDRGVVDSIAYVGSPGFDGDDLSQVTPVDPTTNGTLFWRIDGGIKWRQRLGPKTPASPQGRGLIRPGLRIELPRDSGNWFVVSAFDFDTQVSTNARFYIEGHYSGAAGTPVEYRLELAPTILPNTEPVPLDNGIVIDLDASQIPAAWRDDPTDPLTAAPTIDFMFDSRGSPTGPIASAGLIHLYIGTVSDVELTRGRLPNHPRTGAAAAPFAFPYVPAVEPIVPKTPPYVLSLFTQAGQVTTSAVDFTDIVINSTGTAGSDEFADIPFSFARRGREAQ